MANQFETQSSSLEERYDVHFPQLNCTLELLDYGGGNTGSVIRAFQRLGAVVHQVSSPSEISGLHPLVLPGVGSFGAVMQQLRQKNLVEPIKHAIEAGVPFLGICVGLQVLFHSSEESPDETGLCVLSGRVVRFPDKTADGKLLKVPQIGWNQLSPGPANHCNGAFWTDDPQNNPQSVYFVNSYYALPDDPNCVLYTADYGMPFCAAVCQDNITAFQFHPEKSGHFGHHLLWLWLNGVSQGESACPS